MDTEKMLELVSQGYDELEQEARDLANDFQMWLDEENKGLEVIKRSTLSIRVRRRGDHALAILWCYVRFFRRKDGSWMPRTREIPSGRSMIYPEARIARFAQGWEMEEVMRVERRLARIRRKRNALGKIVRHIKAYSRECRNEEKDRQSEE